MLCLTLTPLSFAAVLPAIWKWASDGGVFSGVVTFVSVTSYSAYLFHTIVIAVVQKSDFYLGGGGGVKLFVKVGELTIILLVSWLSYRYFEKPILKMRDMVVKG
jgi:peptidoglycan/LPS O-acetylase OafA/YrhL